MFRELPVGMNYHLIFTLCPPSLPLSIAIAVHQQPRNPRPTNRGRRGYRPIPAAHTIPRCAWLPRIDMWLPPIHSGRTNKKGAQCSFCLTCWADMLGFIKRLMTYTSVILSIPDTRYMETAFWCTDQVNKLPCQATNPCPNDNSCVRPQQ